MGRLDDLRSLRAGLLARMAEPESDRTYAAMGKLLTEVIEQIDALTGGGVPERETALDEFTRRLRERGSGAPGAGGAAV